MAEEVDVVVRNMVEEHGRRAETVTADRLIEALSQGEEAILHWLHVRKRLRQLTGQDRYTQRISDKIVWAIEQSIDQGRFETARTLGQVWPVLRVQDKRRRVERRTHAQACAA